MLPLHHERLLKILENRLVFVRRHQLGRGGKFQSNPHEIQGFHAPLSARYRILPVSLLHIFRHSVKPSKTSHTTLFYLSPAFTACYMPTVPHRVAFKRPLFCALLCGHMQLASVFTAALVAYDCCIKGRTPIKGSHPHEHAMLSDFYRGRQTSNLRSALAWFYAKSSFDPA